MGDRTAFDAVIKINTDDDRQRLIGVETKYHEYPTAEPRARTDRAGTKSPRTVRGRYRQVAETAGMFSNPEMIDQIVGDKVEQVWRDHLLALACHQHDPERVVDVRYVLVAPAANPPWAVLANRYNTMLAPSMRSTFEHRTVDELIDAVASVVDYSEFRARYLDVVIQPVA